MSAIASTSRPRSFVLPPPLALSLAAGNGLAARDRSPIVVERPIPPAAAVHRHRPASPAASAAIRPATPWYKTTWGIAGIGLIATGATLGLDRNINHFTQTHLSYNFRDHVPLNIADALTDGSLIFAGTTWFQSPWAGPKLAARPRLQREQGVRLDLWVFGRGSLANAIKSFCDPGLPSFPPMQSAGLTEPGPFPSQKRNQIGQDQTFCFQNNKYPYVKPDPIPLNVLPECLAPGPAPPKPDLL